MNNRPVITVIGSINMDLVVTTSRNPVAGETIIGNSFKTIPGGKGANQAVAAARLGSEVRMIGKIGSDELGKKLIANLQRENISVEGVTVAENEFSGIASITVTEQDNSIIIVPGANQHVTPAYVREYAEVIADSDMVLVQLEIPMETIEEIAHICQEFDVPFNLNPAPGQKVDYDILDQAAYITPNEHEREQILHGEEAEVLSKWPGKLIITKGEMGCSYHDGTEQINIPAFPVEPVDTTGAGDTFNGAFAFCMAEDMELDKACRFANAAAALSVQKAGAQAGMPTLAEVKEFLANHG